MNVYSTLLAAVAVLAVGPPVRAADFTPPPAYGAFPAPHAQPFAQPAEGLCPSCAASAAGRCKACGHALAHGHKNKGPYFTTLCPGACFGYFQTQWRKWDEVCPLPYQGVGVSDAPKPPSPQLPSAYDRLPPDKKGGMLPTPRPVDPKGGELPPAPPPGDDGGFRPIPLPSPPGRD